MSDARPRTGIAFGRLARNRGWDATARMVLAATCYIGVNALFIAEQRVDAQETRSSSFFDGKKSNSSGGFQLPKFELPKWFGGKDSGSPPSSNPVKLASAEAPVRSNKASSKSDSSITAPITATWSKFQSSTKQAWGKFASAINPFDGRSKKSTPSNQGYRPQDEREESSGSGLFFWQNPEPEPIDDVNSFLSLPRPRLP